MVVSVEGRDIEVAIVEYDEYRVVVVELTEQSAVLVVVESVDIGVVPHLPSAQSRVSMALESDAMDGVSRHEIAL